MVYFKKELIEIFLFAFSFVLLFLMCVRSLNDSVEFLEFLTFVILMIPSYLLWWFKRLRKHLKTLSNKKLSDVFHT